VKTLFALQAISSLATLGATSFWAIGLYLLFQFFFDSHLNVEGKRVIKFLICWIGVADTIRQAFTVEAVIKGGGQLWSNQFYYIVIASSKDITFGSAGVYFSSAMVSLPAQSFFVYRMWQFSQRPWFIPVLAMPVLLFQLVFPLVLLSNSERLREQDMFLFIATCVAGAILDLVTCVGLTILLWGRYLSAQKSTTSILRRLILLSINTGLWTTLVSIYVIVVLITTVRVHEQPPLGCFHLISPLYFATVLVNLNSRHYIRSAASRTVSKSSRHAGAGNPIAVAIPLDTMTSDGLSSNTDSLGQKPRWPEKSLTLSQRETV
jgi:hypothetical protein